MAFIDGENLVNRYQAMIKAGRVSFPPTHVAHARDEYVWSPHLPRIGSFQAIRALYYTSAVGDADHIVSLEDYLKQVIFSRSETAHPYCSLHPVIVKRPSKSVKMSTVDIQLTVDLLSHAYRGTVDTFFLFSGDGDFIPLVREVARLGRRVFVFAFSSGLSRRLANAADRFYELDRFYFEPVEQAEARFGELPPLVPPILRASD